MSTHPTPSEPSIPSPPPPSYEATTRNEPRRRNIRQRPRNRNINAAIRREILINNANSPSAFSNLTRTMVNELRNERNFELFRVIIQRNCRNREMKLLVSRGTMIIFAIILTSTLLMCCLIIKLYLM